MHGITAFLRNDTGAVTIEFVKLVPMFTLMLVFFIDCSVVYLTRTEMWNTARDISRRISTGELTTIDEVNSYAASHLFLGGRAYKISVNFGTESTVKIDVPTINAAIFGAWLTPVVGDTLSAAAVMRAEPRLV
jgi:Flp pilus assembly protein TadG